MPLDKGDYEYTHLFRFLRDGYVYNLSLIQLSSILLFLEKANEFSQFSIRYCNTCGKDEFLEIDALNDIIKFLKENKASNRSVYKLDFAGDSFRIVEEERERNENKDFNYLCNVLNDLSSTSRREGLKLNEYFCDIESNGLINYFKIYNTPKEVQQKIEPEVVAIKEKAEENNMSESKLFPKLKFGKLNDSSVKISHLGIAIKNKEDIYVSYDRSTKSILNVDILSVDAGSLLYAIPIQISDIKEGDCILHNGTYYYIRFNNNNNVIKGVNYYDGVEEVIDKSIVVGYQKQESSVKFIDKSQTDYILNGINGTKLTLTGISTSDYVISHFTSGSELVEFDMTNEGKLILDHSLTRTISIHFATKG